MSPPPLQRPVNQAAAKWQQFVIFPTFVRLAACNTAVSQWSLPAWAWHQRKTAACEYGPWGKLKTSLDWFIFIHLRARLQFQNHNKIFGFWIWFLSVQWNELFFSFLFNEWNVLSIFSMSKSRHGLVVKRPNVWILCTAVLLAVSSTCFYFITIRLGQYLTCVWWFFNHLFSEQILLLASVQVHFYTLCISMLHK